jgi:hypothetical protein
MFPVRYELNLYLLFRSSICKRLSKGKAVHLYALMCCRLSHIKYMASFKKGAIF